jgi:hypothetical protein
MRTEIRACTQLGTLYKMLEKKYKKERKVFETKFRNAKT